MTRGAAECASRYCTRFAPMKPAPPVIRIVCIQCVGGWAEPVLAAPLPSLCARIRVDGEGISRGGFDAGAPCPRRKHAGPERRRPMTVQKKRPVILDDGPENNPGSDLLSHTPT